MTVHEATVRWRFDGEPRAFRQGQYSRAHTWTFDGGLCLLASPSPAVVKPPHSDPSAVDPEEAFVASVSSCHMLTFLYLAHRRGFEVRGYEDRALGTMTKNERGVPWVSRVVLRPHVTYGSRAPSADEEAALHERAHAECFIANSVRTDIVVEPGDGASPDAAAPPASTKPPVVTNGE